MYGFKFMNDENQNNESTTPAQVTSAKKALNDAAPQAAPAAEEGPKVSRAPRKRFFKTAKELILEELPLRAGEASSCLKECLMGTVLIDIKDKNEFYRVIWNAGGFKVEEGGGAADCTIHLSEQHLLKIVSGDLNPQIAMLSDKIFVEGKLNLGVYFFNLIAPVVQ